MQSQFLVEKFCLAAALVLAINVTVGLPSLSQDDSGPWRTRLYKSFPMTRTAKAKAAPKSQSAAEPQSASATSALVRAKQLMKAGEFAAAITTLESAQKLFPTNQSLYLEAGECLIHERRLNDALMNANLALIKCPPSAPIYRQRANANYMLHDYPGALRDLDLAGKLAPLTAEDYFTKANCFGSLGNPKAVIENVCLGLKLDPKNSEAYYLRAKTYKNLNQNALAEADFAKAMALGK